MCWELDAGILARGVMRHFLKIANHAFIACAGKFSVKIFWEKFGKVNHQLS